MPSRTSVIAAIAAACLSVSTLAQPVTDSFVYQGELLDDGDPANGLFDITFIVYEDLVGGVPVVGGTQTVTNVQVTDGRFETLVDFALSGAIFDSDQARYLELRVSEAGQPGTTILAPRQFIAPAPLSNYALRSGESLFAETSGTSLNDAYINGARINTDATPVTIGTDDPFSIAQLRIGSPAPDVSEGILRIYNNSGFATIEHIGNEFFAGYGFTNWHDASGNLSAFVSTDFSPGGGGLISLNRSSGGPEGVTLEGNLNGSQSAALSLFGSAVDIALRTDIGGDGSVVLPFSSISSFEIEAEAGAGETTQPGSTLLTPSSGNNEILDATTINAPDDGVILVIATGEVSINHTNGANSAANFSVNLGSGVTSIASHADVELRLDADLPSGQYDFPVTVHGLFNVGDGMNTVNFLGRQIFSTGTITVFDRQLTAVYLPTARGSVSLNTQEILGSDLPDELAPRVPSMTPFDILAEQNAALRADAERQQRELAEVRALVEQMRADRELEQKNQPQR